MGHTPSDMFKALSVPTRLRIIELLKERGEIGVNEIAEKLGVTPPAVSQHMKLLMEVGLVTKERRGYRVPYSVDANGLDSCLEMLTSTCCCEGGGHGDTGHAESHGGTSCCGSGSTTHDLTSLARRAELLEAELKAVRKEIAKLEKEVA